MRKVKQNKAPLFSPKNIVIDFIRVTGAIPTLLLLRPKKTFASEKAKEKIRGGALIIANHTEFIDPVYLMTVFW